jgi:chloramphenicol 3-O phosphotransferase
MTATGQIVILNGAPRSGKSSIVAVVQDTFPGAWMNLGVDVWIQRVMAPHLRPGIGLRPGGEKPSDEALVPAMYAALYESIASHSREGLNVVVDVGHHDAYSVPLGIVADARRRTAGLPVCWVGVRCPIDVIMQRRGLTPEDPVPPPVQRWQDSVHAGMTYDVEVDTSQLSPVECAAHIRTQIERD